MKSSIHEHKNVKSMLSNKIIAVLLMLSTTLGFSQSPQTSWNVDKSHSSVSFSIDHLVISETDGKFNTYSADIKADKADFSDAKGTITIDVKSIDTDNEKRDEHLRNSDFFDADKFPTITFKIAKFTKVSGNKYKVTGDLTMHGVTKTVTLDAKFNGIIKDPWGNTRTGVVVTGELDRYEFGLKYNSALEAGGLTIGQEVRIKVSLEFVKSNS